MNIFTYISAGKHPPAPSQKKRVNAVWKTVIQENEIEKALTSTNFASVCLIHNRHVTLLLGRFHFRQTWRRDVLL